MEAVGKPLIAALAEASKAGKLPAALASLVPGIIESILSQTKRVVLVAVETLETLLQTYKETLTPLLYSTASDAVRTKHKGVDSVLGALLHAPVVHSTNDAIVEVAAAAVQTCMQLAPTVRRGSPLSRIPRCPL